MKKNEPKLEAYIGPYLTSMMELSVSEKSFIIDVNVTEELAVRRSHEDCETFLFLNVYLLDKLGICEWFRGHCALCY